MSASRKDTECHQAEKDSCRTPKPIPRTVPLILIANKWLASHLRAPLVTSEAFPERRLTCDFYFVSLVTSLTRDFATRLGKSAQNHL